nr:reverse transcriptase domain-containing protein [Tanacetum cinerariifolium]
MPTWCHMFNSTLIGSVRVWFDELPLEIIDGYKGLKAAFLAYFMQQKKYVKDPVEIHNIKQMDMKTIKEFMERFKIETGHMKRVPECMRISGFMHGVNNHELTKCLNERVLKTLEEMMTPTTAFIRGEPRLTRQKVTQTFAHVKEIKFPPLTANKGTEGLLVIEAEIGGHEIHRIYVDGGSSMEHDGSWRMCVGFTDLNKACPRDCYPLLEIDWKVESLCGYPFKCFLDAYKGYHQIQMAEQDEEKTAFHTSHGSSRRNVSRIHDQSGRDKTLPRQDGGCVAAPIPTDNQREVHQKSDFYWTPKAKQAFKQLKQHLAKLPMLVAPKPKEELIMYLSASHGAISAVLMIERDTVQTPVYFVSRALQDPELNYTPIEKLVLVLVCAAKRPRTSVKGKILTDFLVEKPDDAPPKAPVIKTLQEPWILFMDGSSYVDRSGAGLILTSLERTEFTYTLRFQFTASNNEAEYEALIVGLRIAVQMGLRNVHVSVDSKLVGNQVLGTYVAKEENMIKYLENTKSLISGFTNFSISQVPRSKNKKVDALSKIASTSFAHLSKQVLVEVIKEKSTQEREMETVVEEEGQTWMTPIIEYLRDETLPDNRKEARKLRIKARQYELLEGILYRRSFLKPWLRCVGPLQADYLIREIHEGSCSMHAGPQSVVSKAMQSGYYWPTMHHDAQEMIRKWPGKVKFLIVTMDYFTKWIEAKAMATITGSQVKKFVWDNIVFRFWTPRGDSIRQRSLGEGIKACLGEGNKNWLKEPPHVLWAQHMTIKSSNDDTPFSLTYRTEAVIPAEIRMPTYRTTVINVVHNDGELRLNLDLLEERSERAAIREAKAKSMMKKYYNARVRGVTFRPGNFVYCSNDASYAVDGRKLGPNWEGSYELTEALGDGAYKLRSTDGTVLSRTWSIANLKKCYL